MRKLLGQGRAELARQRRIEPAQRVRRLREFEGELAALLQLAGNAGGGENAVAHGGEVAGAAAAEDEPRQRAGEIGRRREPRAQLGACRSIGHEKFDGVLVPLNGAGVGERSGKALRQEPRARSRHRAVDRGEQ